MSTDHMVLLLLTAMVLPALCWTWLLCNSEVSSTTNTSVQQNIPYNTQIYTQLVHWDLNTLIFIQIQILNNFTQNKIPFARPPQIEHVKECLIYAPHFLNYWDSCARKQTSRYVFLPSVALEIFAFCEIASSNNKSVGHRLTQLNGGNYPKTLFS